MNFESFTSIFGDNQVQAVDGTGFIIASQQAGYAGFYIKLSWLAKPNMLNSTFKLQNLSLGTVAW
jgi:hypothetical protein